MRVGAKTVVSKYTLKTPLVSLFFFLFLLLLLLTVSTLKIQSHFYVAFDGSTLAAGGIYGNTQTPPNSARPIKMMLVATLKGRRRRERQRSSVADSGIVLLKHIEWLRTKN